MVQVEIEQLTGECSSWREKLRQHREEFTQHKTKLQQSCSQSLSKDQLQEVEHLHNQFHIQLINIHDIKQAIKTHERKMMYEMAKNDGQVNDETIAVHEILFGQYENLEQTLLELREEFDGFLRRTNC